MREGAWAPPPRHVGCVPLGTAGSDIGDGICWCEQGAWFTDGAHVGVLLHPKVAAHNEPYEVCAFDLADGSSLLIPPAAAPGLAPLQLATLEGRAPSDMTCETHRLATFGAWPHMEFEYAVPAALAAAGFFFAPEGVAHDRCVSRYDRPRHVIHVPHLRAHEGATHEHCENPLSITLLELRTARSFQSGGKTTDAHRTRWLV
jgi:hypothetical protein